MPPCAAGAPRSSATTPLAPPQLGVLHSCSPKHQCLAVNLWSLALFGAALPLLVLRRLEGRARAAFERQRRGRQPAQARPWEMQELEPGAGGDHTVLSSCLHLWLTSGIVWAAVVAFVPNLA